MPIPRRDNDEIRAMGYVALFSGYLEESIGICFETLRCFDTQPTNQMWRSSARVKSCIRAIGQLPRTDDLQALLKDLVVAADLLRDRNIVIHSPLYGQIQGPNVRQAAKPEDREKFVNADQIYDLAGELDAFSEAFAAYAVRLPRFIDEALTA